MDALSTTVVDTLRDSGYMSHKQLEVIARSPELGRAWKAALANDFETARTEFKAASGSSCEAVAALGQVGLVNYSTADADQILTTCNQLAEQFHGSPDAVVRTAGIDALIVAGRQPDAGIEALHEAARRADDDPELRVTAAEVHLEIARWWCKRHKEALANADWAITEYDVVISRATSANEPALQVIVQLARNEKTELLIHHLEEEAIPTLKGDAPTILHWALARSRGDDMSSSEQAITTAVLPDAPAILRWAIARAWLTHGSLLYNRNDTKQGAVEALAELDRLFGSDPSPQVQDVVRQGHELEERARHVHHIGRFISIRVNPQADFRIPFLRYGRQVNGWKPIILVSTVIFIVTMALLGLWPVSRRIFETVNDISDAREQTLYIACTAVFSLTAAAVALGWLVRNARSLLRGESARWRQLGVGLILALLLALAIAGLIFTGGKIMVFFG